MTLRCGFERLRPLVGLTSTNMMSSPRRHMKSGHPALLTDQPFPSISSSKCASASFTRLIVFFILLSQISGFPCSFPKEHGISTHGQKTRTGKLPYSELERMSFDQDVSRIVRSTTDPEPGFQHVHCLVFWTAKAVSVKMAVLLTQVMPRFFFGGQPCKTPAGVRGHGNVGQFFLH